MSDSQEFLDAVERFGQEVIKKCPELDHILKKAKAGSISTEQAVKDVWKILGSGSDSETTLEKALFESFGIEPRSTDLAHFPERSRMLERWGFSEEDLIFEPFEDRPHYQMLHPLLMGMIVELLQYDGDVPELRSGKLPEGGSPAVPVRTGAKDPVYVGALLQKASAEVMRELDAAQGEHNLKVARLIEAVGGVDDAATGLVRQETERGIGVPGYIPGQKAQIREVTSPKSALDLSQMELHRRQKLAHKTLTSTQGRRSVSPVIEDMVLEGLHKMGYTAIRTGHGEEVFADEEWTIGIEGGAGERNPRFNFVDTAARALVAKLGRQLASRAARYTCLRLLVTPINEVADRRVGWRAALYE